MVRKLVKYDFVSFFRLLFPVQMIILGIALINRLIQLFEVEKSSAYTTVFVSSIVLLVIACIVSLVMTLILSVVRFYQGLYSTEGYLSHTLPVTPSQHIFAKLLVSLLFVAGTVLTIFLAICIATCGEVNIELFKAAGYLLGKGFNEIGFQMILYMLEILVYAVLWISNVLMVFYFCLSIGQLVPRKKILLAFGVLFGLYIIIQIIGTAGIIIVTVSPDWFEALYEAVSQFSEAHPNLFFHLVMTGSILMQLIEIAVFFIISKTIMKKKLNLT
ncbi:MAG: hypothetical protein IJJ15_00885 [Ruminococcus sp.]|nr:hypothetical protein [Ruminococcus sp.]